MAQAVERRELCACEVARGPGACEGEPCCELCSGEPHEPRGLGTMEDATWRIPQGGLHMEDSTWRILHCAAQLQEFTWRIPHGGFRMVDSTGRAPHGGFRSEERCRAPLELPRGPFWATTCCSR